MAENQTKPNQTIHNMHTADEMNGFHFTLIIC